MIVVQQIMTCYRVESFMTFVIAKLVWEKHHSKNRAQGNVGVVLTLFVNRSAK